MKRFKLPGKTASLTQGVGFCPIPFLFVLKTLLFACNIQFYIVLLKIVL